MQKETWFLEITFFYCWWRYFKSYGL